MDGKGRVDRDDVVRRGMFQKEAYQAFVRSPSIPTPMKIRRPLWSVSFCE
jgi:hypothetical protein